MYSEVHHISFFLEQTSIKRKNNGETNGGSATKKMKRMDMSASDMEIGNSGVYLKTEESLSLKLHLYTEYYICTAKLHGIE